MSERRTHLDTAAVGLMVLLCASWGLQQVAIKVANAGISPVFQAGLRSLGATALLWAWARWQRIPLFQRDGSLVAGVSAGLLFAGEFCLLYWGLLFTNASRSVVFLYTAPFWVAAGAHLFIPGERLRPAQVGGLLCAFGGILAAFTDAFALPTTGRQVIGDLMALGAGLFWGATTVLVKVSRLATIPATKTLFYQLAASAVALPVLAIVLGEPGVTALTPLVAGSLLYQTVGVAFASYLAWFWLVARYPASRLSTFSFLTPLFGVLAGGLLLGEPLGPGLLLALVLVAVGIRLVNRPPRRP